MMAASDDWEAGKRYPNMNDQCPTSTLLQTTNCIAISTYIKRIKCISRTTLLTL